MKLAHLALGLIAAALLTGCGSGTQTTATKEEQSSYTNPRLTPPPEAGQMGPKSGAGAPPAGPAAGPPPGPPPGAQAGPG